MLYWCVRDRESKRTETSLSALCFYYHCVQSSMCLLTVHFLPSASFALSPAARHWQSCPGSLCYLDRACHTSSPPPFPAQLPFMWSLQHMQPLTEKKHRSILNLNWVDSISAWTRKIQVGGWGGQTVLPRDFCAAMMNHSLIPFHCPGHKHLFTVLTAEPWASKGFNISGIHVQDCCCYCHDIIWVWWDKQFFEMPLPTCTRFSINLSGFINEETS